MVSVAARVAAGIGAHIARGLSQMVAHRVSVSALVRVLVLVSLIQPCVRPKNKRFYVPIGIAIMPSPRPAFVGGKGSPCEKQKGSLCEEES